MKNTGKKQFSLYHKNEYLSPLGKMISVCDYEGNIAGLWFEGQRHFGGNVDIEKAKFKNSGIFDKLNELLNLYFKGKNPDFSLISVKPEGTSFQKEVWEMLLKIPYGKTVTYGFLAQNIAKKRGVPIISARAVGAAIGRNPIAIIIPCHRVIGHGGKLTGYAAGPEIKKELLKIEGINISLFKN